MADQPRWVNDGGSRPRGSRAKQVRGAARRPVTAGRRLEASGGERLGRAAVQKATLGARADAKRGEMAGGSASAGGSSAMEAAQSSSEAAAVVEMAGPTQCAMAETGGSLVEARESGGSLWWLGDSESGSLHADLQVETTRGWQKFN